MRNLSNAFQMSIFLGILLISSTLISLPFSANASTNGDVDKLDKLENKIAKNYASKFCNAIGIGISREGAIRLAISENQNSKFNPGLWFELASSGEENLSQIDNTKLDYKISEKIIASCGPAIGLSGQKGIESFESYFRSLKTDAQNS